jgi:drug/metabolite transporter (DMT)-like permease
MHASRLWHSPYLLLSLTSFFWSANWVIGRATVGEVPPVALAYLRWILAVLFMLPFAWPSLRREWPAIKRNWKAMIGLGVLGTGYHNLFSYLGLQYTTATNGVMLNSAIPVFIFALGVMFFGQRIALLQLVGLFVSLAGVLTIIARGDPALLAQFQLNGGDLILLASMVQWAFYTLALKWRPQGVSSLAFLCVCATVGVMAMTPAYAFDTLVLGKSIKWSWAVVGALIYVGLFPSFIGYVFWNRGVEAVGPSVAGLFVHLMPVFGSVLAWAFLSERLYWFHLAGIALILSGIWITSRKAAPAAPAPVD